jgi:hypothetical protein
MSQYITDKTSKDRFKKQATDPKGDYTVFKHSFTVQEMALAFLYFLIADQ